MVAESLIEHLRRLGLEARAGSSHGVTLDGPIQYIDARQEFGLVFLALYFEGAPPPRAAGFASVEQAAVAVCSLWEAIAASSDSGDREEAVAAWQKRLVGESHTSLPRELESLLERLAPQSCASTHDAIKLAFSEVEDTDPRLDVDLPLPSIRSYRADAILSVGRDTWVLPQPTLEAVGKCLGALFLATQEPTVASVIAAVWQGVLMVYGSTKLTFEQAVVLRTLKRADKGTGWTVERVVDELPEEAGLGRADVSAVIEELRSLRTVKGERPKWSIEENPQVPGSFWTLLA